MHKSKMFGKTVIYCEEKEWVMVYSAQGLSQAAQDLLKVHYNVAHLTIVLRDYKE